MKTKYQAYYLKKIEDKTDYLQDLVKIYLLKDILEFENIKNSDKIFDLLRLIAFQIGAEVSYNEIGRQLSMSKNTVEKYLDLLSKVYILHSVSAFSRNLRKEIVKGKKWYFYDNGLRNILIGNMNSIESVMILENFGKIISSVSVLNIKNIAGC